MCTGLRPLNGAGSSARFIVRTCIQCGLKTKRERHEKQFDPEECPRETIDHRGATKDLARSFCTRCLTYADEGPRELADEKKSAAEKVKRATNLQAEAVGQPVETDRAVSRDQIKGALRTFSRRAA